MWHREFGPALAQAHMAVRLLTWHLQPLSFPIHSIPYPAPKDELNRHHTSFYFILLDKQNVSSQLICICSCNTLDVDRLWYIGGFLWRGQIPICVIERRWWALSKGWLLFILWLKTPDKYHNQKLEQHWGEGQELRAKGELRQSRSALGSMKSCWPLPPRMGGKKPTWPAASLRNLRFIPMATPCTASCNRGCSNISCRKHWKSQAWPQITRDCKWAGASWLCCLWLLASPMAGCL